MVLPCQLGVSYYCNCNGNEIIAWHYIIVAIATETSIDQIVHNLSFDKQPAVAQGLSIHYGREWYRSSNPLTFLLSFSFLLIFFLFMEFWILLDYLTHNKASCGKKLITVWRHLWFCHVSWELFLLQLQ